MSAIKSRRFHVQLVPSAGHQIHASVAPTENFQLPLDRQEFCEGLEKELHPSNPEVKPEVEANLVDGPYHGMGVTRTLAVLRFAPGTPDWVALHWTLRQAERVYRALVPTYIQNAVRKTNRLEKRQKTRGERRSWRMDPEVRWAFSRR